ncbi:hypothetical protein SCLCIDRAFT_1216531 [Scleroderma citrinum Foug A]|uniref:Uncharacterized protein n=1 Tax=Scleroderma citrinum Foug A TaxID=1036808 RepID=A0A0C3A7I0_9AGAM|nr:hypothetical protein SCLCIDRAFT_1216531 [Scleroderma citrinum Foug A]
MYKTQTEWRAILQTVLSLPTAKMVRFLVILPLLLISHTVPGVAAAGVLHFGNTDNVMDIIARADCKACAQRSAMITRAAAQETWT